MIDANTATAPVAPAIKRNREQWLTDFVALSLPLIQERTGLALGDRQIQISCGFPGSGARVRKNGSYTAGVCHHTHGTERKRFQIFMHPGEVAPVRLAGIAMHEILHALLPGGTGHRKPFANAAKKLGLEGKPTQATDMTNELAEAVKPILAILGDYPHEAVWSHGKKQTTRLLKAMCHQCGYTVRVTSKWLDEAGYPICPSCSEEMGPDEGDFTGDPLVPIEQGVEYKVKNVNRMKKTDPIYDPRWSVFMKRTANEVVWSVIDYGRSIDDEGKATLGIVQARWTPAESREDAIDLMEGLRDGTVTYKDIETNDNEFVDDDWFDESPDELAEDEPDTFDFEEDDSDPRFQFEIDRGIKVEDINPDHEADKREAWAANQEEAACPMATT